MLDFSRCAMLPLRGEPTGEAGDEVGGAEDLEHEDLVAAAAGYDLSALPRRAASVAEGELEGGDVVDSAPALARLTLNVAMAHLDATRAAHGQRLVYGGHTIAIAAAQAARARARTGDDPRLARRRPHRRRCSRATRCARRSRSSGASRSPAAASSSTCART